MSTPTSGTRSAPGSHQAQDDSVAIVLIAGAGIVALVGKKDVGRATPPAPEHAIEGVKEDIAVVKGEHR
jgi:hypothetical protein